MIQREQSLDTPAIVELLQRHGILKQQVPNIHVTRLTGGSMNRVYLVRTPHVSIVIKEVLERIDETSGKRLVSSRALLEYEALRLLWELLPSSFVKPLFIDRLANIIGMEPIPGDAHLLESDLMNGTVDAEIAGTLGKVCATFHGKTAGSIEISKNFANEDVLSFKLQRQCFDVRVAPQLKEHIRTSVMRLLGHRTALIHGDLCPKNIFVSRDNVVLLDLEETHYGNPAFEIGYIIAHYWIIAIIENHPIDTYAMATQSLWFQYQKHWQNSMPLPLEKDIILMIGIFMLSRIDGVARPKWITIGERSRIVRHIALALLRRAPERMLDALRLLKAQTVRTLAQ